MQHSVRIARWTVATLALLALIVAVSAGSALAGSGSSTQIDLRAELNGDDIDGVEPRGEARFVEKIDDDEVRREFEVKVQDVNLDPGTELDVAVNGDSVGTITLEDNQDGELRLRSDDGDDVPALAEDDEVTVSTPDGDVILSGTLEKH